MKLLDIVSVAKLVNILKFSLVNKDFHDYKFFAASSTPDFSAYNLAIYSISDGSYDSHLNANKGNSLTLQ